MLFITSKKKKYFIKKGEAVLKMIWDLEFKREKTLMIKEDVRREYDGACSKLQITDAKILSQLKTEKICEVHNPEKGKEKVHRDKGTCVCEYVEKDFIGKDELERLYDQHDILVRDRDRFILQMKGMDIDIQGCTATNEFPEGVNGINQQLEALRELKVMIKQYIKQL